MHTQKSRLIFILKINLCLYFKDEIREVLKVHESINESSENPNSNCDVVLMEDKVEIMNLHKEETLPVRRKTQLNEKFELLWPQPKVNMNEYF